MVAAIQLAIMLGAGFGGCLLDRVSITATFAGGAALLALASGIMALHLRASPAATLAEVVKRDMSYPTL